jgi:hypothetical protein
MQRPIFSDGSERRGAPRKVLRAAVNVRLADGQVIVARGVDISLSGVGVTCERNLPARLPCRVDFPLLIEGMAYTVELPATVAYTVLSAKQGGFMVGVKFNSMPPEVSKVIARFMLA